MVETRSQAVLDPDEVPFLAFSATAITVLAYVADPGPPAALLALAPALLAFVLQGRLARWPSEVRAGLVAGPVYVTIAVTGDLQPILFLSVTMLLYVAAEEPSSLRAAAIAVVLAVLPFAVAVIVDDQQGWVEWTLAHGFTWSIGRLIHRQRALITELEEARRALADRAVAEERRRIARELHDLAGHTLAAMLLHVTGARHVLRRDVDEAERALVDAEGVGRASLDAIRGTVAALRADESGTDAGPVHTADLEAVAEEYRRAGLDVEVDDALGSLGGPAAIAMHRITREALANVARHAPTNRVRVRARLTDDVVELTVADRGTPPDGPGPGPHFGVIGMRERARALGGDLEAGPHRDGWRVAAKIPVGSVPVEAVGG